MRRYVNASIVAATALAGMLPPSLAFGQSSRDGTPPAAGAQGVPQTSRPDLSQAAPQVRLWSVSAAASSVFESNIDRTPTHNQAEGLILGLGAQYRNRVDRPTFTAQYQIGGHMYANAPRWNRISHNARAAYERRLSEPLTFVAVGEMSIRGSTEDRELGNQYIVSPRLQWRLSPGLRLAFESGYRVKRYEDRGRNATNPYGGVRFTQRVGRNRWGLGYRYEENHADAQRRRYNRSTFSGDVTVPFAPQDRFGFEVKIRPRRYERQVRVADRSVRLRDLKWSLSPEWVHALSPRLQLRASYEFEARGANDPARTYRAHSTALAVERRW